MYPFTKIIRALGHGPNHRRITAKKASRSSREIANPLTVFPDQHNYSFKSTEQIFFFPLFSLFSSLFFFPFGHAQTGNVMSVPGAAAGTGAQGSPPPGTPGSGGTALGCLQSAKPCTGGSRGPDPAPRLPSTPALQSGAGTARDMSSGGTEQLESTQHPKSYTHSPAVPPCQPRQQNPGLSQLGNAVFIIFTASAG